MPRRHAFAPAGLDSCGASWTPLFSMSRPALAVSLQINDSPATRTSTWVTLLDSYANCGLTASRKSATTAVRRGTVLCRRRAHHSCSAPRQRRRLLGPPRSRASAKTAASVRLQQAFMDHDAFQCGYSRRADLSARA